MDRLTSLDLGDRQATLTLTRTGQANALSDGLVRQLLADVDRVEAAACTSLVLQSGLASSVPVSI